MKIGDRVDTPGGHGTIVILEGSATHTAWINMDHADSNYHWMRFSNENKDEGLLTVNKYPIESIKGLNND